MSAKLTAPRTDFPFITRRVRPGSVPVQPQPTAARTSLRLGAPTNDDVPAKPSYVMPTLTRGMSLSDDSPVIRLNRRQAAIGSLVFGNIDRFGWEIDGKRGMSTFDSKPDPDVPVYGGRPLVQPFRGQIVLGLRHFAHLRRLVMWVDGNLRAQVRDQTDEIVFTVEPSDNGVILIISRIGNQLEIRREQGTNRFGFDNVSIYRVFDEALTTKPEIIERVAQQGRKPRLVDFPRVGIKYVNVAEYAQVKNLLWAQAFDLYRTGAVEAYRDVDGALNLALG